MSYYALYNPFDVAVGPGTVSVDQARAFKILCFASSVDRDRYCSDDAHAIPLSEDAAHKIEKMRGLQIIHSERLPPPIPLTDLTGEADDDEDDPYQAIRNDGVWAGLATEGR